MSYYPRYINSIDSTLAKLLTVEEDWFKVLGFKHSDILENIFTDQLKDFKPEKEIVNDYLEVYFDYLSPKQRKLAKLYNDKLKPSFQQILTNLNDDTHW